MNPRPFLVGTVLTFVIGETIHLAHHDGLAEDESVVISRHHDADTPKQVHTEHKHFSAPEKPSFTLVQTGSVVITPVTGSIHFGL